MQQLILFLTRYRNNLLLVALLLLAFIRHSLKSPISEHWINTVGTGISASYTNTTSGWKSYWSLDDINEELARENAALRASMWQKKAPEFFRSEDYEFIPARVIDYSYRKRNNYILINCGKRMGVNAGMGVISNEGWVGVISESTSNYSYVTPFVHSKGDIGARIRGKGLGQLSWTGQPKMGIIKDIEREFQPEIGDSIYTYTRAEIAPPVLAGVVASREQSKEDLSWEAQVQLSTDFTNLNWVYICRFEGRTELDSLKTAIQ